MAVGGDRKAIHAAMAAQEHLCHQEFELFMNVDLHAARYRATRLLANTVSLILSFELHGYSPLFAPKKPACVTILRLLQTRIQGLLSYIEMDDCSCICGCLHAFRRCLLVRMHAIYCGPRSSSPTLSCGGKRKKSEIRCRSDVIGWSFLKHQ